MKLALKFFSGFWIILLINLSVESKDDFEVYFVQELMINLHQNPSRYSQVLTTLTCNHPLKVSRKPNVKLSDESSHWAQVKVGGYVGFVDLRLLSSQRAQCFEANYPKFFDGFQLRLVDMYYLARLHDQMIVGETKK